VIADEIVPLDLDLKPFIINRFAGEPASHLLQLVHK
jgi:hypothetical protein